MNDKKKPVRRDTKSVVVITRYCIENAEALNASVIDWERFRSAVMNLGSKYLELPTVKEIAAEAGVTGRDAPKAHTNATLCRRISQLEETVGFLTERLEALEDCATHPAPADDNVPVYALQSE